MKLAQARHESETLAELRTMTRAEIEAKMAAEENSFTRLLCWEYLETL